MALNRECYIERYAAGIAHFITHLENHYERCARDLGIMQPISNAAREMGEIIKQILG